MNRNDNQRRGHRKQMKKYKVFRSLESIDKDIEKHELIAVEYGEDIYAVTDKLIKMINDDATGLEKYASGYTAYAYEPGAVTGHEHYDYYVMAVLAPEYGEENDLLEYGIVEEAE